MNDKTKPSFLKRTSENFLMCVFAIGLALFCSCSDDNDNPVTDDAVPDPSTYALVDLHLHLDGSLSPEDVLEMAKMGGVTGELPSTDSAVLKEALSCPENTKDLTEYLKCSSFGFR